MGIGKLKRRNYQWPTELARLVGRWESERLRMLRPNERRLMESLAMERVWSSFPKKSHPRQLRVTDVEDWKVAQRKRGRSESAIRLDLEILRQWYNWLRKDLGIELDNPVILGPRPSPKPTPYKTAGGPLLPPD